MDITNFLTQNGWYIFIAIVGIIGGYYTQKGKIDRLISNDIDLKARITASEASITILDKELQDNRLSTVSTLSTLTANVNALTGTMSDMRELLNKMNDKIDYLKTNA